MPTGISRVLVNGTPGDDLLIARPEPSRLLGGDGNDILLDGPGSDLLVGDGGNNRLHGGLGDDYYRYELYAGGRDLILDFDPTPGNLDTLIIQESFEELGPFERYGDDLLIGLQGEPGVVTIRHFFLDAAFRIERFRFGATTLTDQDILRNFHIDPQMPTGRSADDPPSYTGERIRLTGRQHADRLVAGDQATYLIGRGGNDLLIGSRYSDVLNGGDSIEMMLGYNRWNRLFGGPGNDIYRVDYSGWQGNQWILDYDTTPGNLDTLRIHGPVSARYVSLRGSARGELTIEMDEQRIIIEHYFLDRAFVIEQILFDDGSMLDEASIRQRLNLPPAQPAQAQQGVPEPAPATFGAETEAGSLALLIGALLQQLGG